eukprot:TRINITY_DN14289_c0_g1_i1.p1 TRINITY_DN14289_c0_g1~~TRINITY_DN14289_c0_g1_i1.p1  ORF type:complete len:1051 (-),score=304.96 TRINITY_DN14289_c0_g1_i1:656-3808(-)
MPEKEKISHRKSSTSLGSGARKKSDGRLVVTVIEAGNLVPKTGKKGEEKRPDDVAPFCKVKVGKKLLTTTSAPGSLSPRWNEKFTFENVSLSDTLSVVLRDEVSRGLGHFFGEVVLPLRTLTTNTEFEQTFELKTRKGVTHPVSGVVTLRILFQLRDGQRESLDGTMTIGSYADYTASMEEDMSSSEDETRPASSGLTSSRFLAAPSQSPSPASVVIGRRNSATSADKPNANSLSDGEFSQLKRRSSLTMVHSGSAKTDVPTSPKSPTSPSSPPSIADIVPVKDVPLSSSTTSATTASSVTERPDDTSSDGDTEPTSTASMGSMASGGSPVSRPSTPEIRTAELRTSILQPVASPVARTSLVPALQALSSATSSPRSPSPGIPAAPFAASPQTPRSAPLTPRSEPNGTPASPPASDSMEFGRALQAERLSQEQYKRSPTAAARKSTDSLKDEMPVVRLNDSLDVDIDPKRNLAFVKRFNLPENEKLLKVYTAALAKGILVHGRMYVSHNYICFFSNIFGVRTQEVIDAETIEDLKKNVKGFNNGITLTAGGRVYQFTSMVYRDKAFAILMRVWRRQMSKRGSSLLDVGMALDDPMTEGTTSDTSDTETEADSPPSIKPEDGAPDMMPVTEVYGPPIDNDENFLSPDADTGGFLNAPDANKVLTDEVMPVTVMQFFKLFFSDGAFENLYHKSRGDTGVVVKDWRPQSQLGSGHFRDVTYIAPVTNPLAGVKTARAEETQRYHLTKNRLTVETILMMFGMAYCDYFRVETKWEVVPGKEPTTCVVNTWLAVYFMKKTWFKSAIESSAISESKKSFPRWVELAKKEIAKERPRLDREERERIEREQQAKARFEQTVAAAPFRPGHTRQRSKSANNVTLPRPEPVAVSATLTSRRNSIKGSHSMEVSSKAAETPGERSGVADTPVLVPAGAASPGLVARTRTALAGVSSTISRPFRFLGRRENYQAAVAAAVAAVLVLALGKLWLSLDRLDGDLLTLLLIAFVGVLILWVLVLDRQVSLLERRLSAVEHHQPGPRAPNSPIIGLNRRIRAPAQT